MLKKRQRLTAALALLLTAALVWTAHAQFRGGRWRRSFEDEMPPEQQREQQLMQSAIDPAFKEDVFTFARLHFNGDRGWGYGVGRSWDDDSPLADLSLTYRLYETTSLKVRPGLHYIDITTNDLQQYPFVYIAAAGSFQTSDDEAASIRKYLLSGGFIMADDFWGDDQWEHLRGQLKKIFPDRKPVEINLDHPIFRTVFKFKRLPQIPSVGAYLRYHLSYDPGWPGDHEPHYYAIYDDKQRMMMLICRNNHYGDGWEHEGDDETYFDAFSEPMAYPMLINIVTYASSH